MKIIEQQPTHQLVCVNLHHMDNEISDLLRTIANHLQMRMKEHVTTQQLGLSAFQARVVNLIGRTDGISQLQLATLTERDKAQIARAVKELEIAGHVSSAAKASDKRLKCLSLTSTGQALNQKLNRIREHLTAHALDTLTPEEKQALQLTLSKVVHQLRQDD